MNSTERRSKEKLILRRTPGLLEELVECGWMAESDAEIIKRVHALPPYRLPQYITAAVKAAKPDRNPQAFHYYSAFANYLKYQSEEAYADKFLAPEYSGGNGRANAKQDAAVFGPPSRIAKKCKWELMFAFYYHRIAKPFEFMPRYDVVFQHRIQTFVLGETSVLDISGGLYNRIHKKIGIANCTFLTKLFIEYLWERKMPAEDKAKYIRKAEWILKRNNGYSNLVRKWEPVFSKIKLTAEEITFAKAYGAGLTDNIIEKMDNHPVAGSRHLKRVIELFRTYPGARKKLLAVFEKCTKNKAIEYSKILKQESFNYAIEAILKEIKTGRRVPGLVQSTKDIRDREHRVHYEASKLFI